MKKELSFEEALKELEEIVVNLEKGDISLDDEFVGPSFIENQEDKSRKESRRINNVHRKYVRKHDQSDTSHLDAAK